MQYLEPAHRLVFGNGAFFWEYHYGARSWLTPGLVAVMLKLFDLAGLGDPMWYVGGVKLGFCAISLLIPAGMYFTARQHFGETTARIALIAGAFWYELVGFAHKPMTEFAAAALLLALLALCTRPDPNRDQVGCGSSVSGGTDDGGALSVRSIDTCALGVVLPAHGQEDSAYARVDRVSRRDRDIRRRYVERRTFPLPTYSTSA